MTSKVVSLEIPAGIQRDGTSFDAPCYTDGKWVRFQRNRPRKIGGYHGIFLDAVGLSRGMAMTSVNGFNYVVSGYNNGLEQWITDDDDGVGSGPYAYTLSNFTASNNNLWQFDISYDYTGAGTNNLVAHPGQNLRYITSTANTPVLYGTFPGPSGGLTMSKVGVFTAAGSTNSTNVFTLTTANVRVGAGQSITGAGIPVGTTVLSILGNAVTMSAAATASASITATFDNNIAVSGGCVVIHPYLFVYGNNGLIQNSSAGDFANWVSPDANANNVATGKIVKGLPIRGGSTSPSGLFWAADALIRVSFSPSSVGGVNYYWTYDLVSSQTSIMSSSSVIEYDGIFYWAGVDRFLSYNGVVQEIPNNNNQNYFFDNINLVQRQKVWATKVPRFGEIWWFYPKGDATECTDAIIYNVREKSWYDAGQSLGAQRSAGVFSEVFPKPIWAGNESSAASFTSAGATINTTTTLTLAAVDDRVVPGLSITGRFIQNGTTVVSVVGVTVIMSLAATNSGNISATFTGNNYTLWQHETGVDAVYLKNVDAVQSYFETFSVGTLGGLVGTQQQPGDNLWTRIERIEPDFVQVGEMSVVVTGEGYADDTPVDSAPYVFLPTTLKIDMREQRREMRLRFESNTAGGTYQTGRILLSLTTGDSRSTGNP